MDQIVFSIRQAASGGYPVTFRGLDGRETQLGRIPAALAAPDGGDLEEWIRGGLRGPDGHRRIGSYLHSLLDDGAWPAELARCAVCNGSADEPHLSVLFDIAADELRALPWELMACGGGFAFRESGHQSLRARASSAQPGDAGAMLAVPALPIKVLIVLWFEQDEACVDKEIRSVYRAASRYPEIWQIKVLKTRDEAVIAQEVQAGRPHVVHVIRHSAPDDGAAWPDARSGDAQAAGRSEPGSDRLASLLQGDHAEQRLVLLSFRDSALMVPRVRGTAAGASVIAMQADLGEAAAAEFSTAFYDKLVDGRKVSAATYHGRRALGEKWPLPVLDVSARGDDAFLGLEQANVRWDWFESSPLPPIGRLQEARILEGRGRLIGVVGARGSGKTYLVRRYLTQCQVMGELAVHFELKGNMRHQREVLADAVDEVVNQVDDQLRKEDVDLADAQELRGEVDNLNVLADVLRGDRDPRTITMAEAYDGFVQGLENIATAAGRGLVFVFDGIDKIIAEDLTRFDQIMLEHDRRAGPARAGRVIAVAQTGRAEVEHTGRVEVDHADLREWRRRHVPMIALGAFAFDEYVDVAREACRWTDLKYDALVGWVEDMRREREQLTPQLLATLIKIKLQSKSERVP